MEYSPEVLHHFTCDKCKMWWSISAIAEMILNKKGWWCPWCGHQHIPPHNNVTIGHNALQDAVDRVAPNEYDDLPTELRERIENQKLRDQAKKEEFG